MKRPSMPETHVDADVLSKLNQAAAEMRVPRAVLVREALRRIVGEYQDTGTVRFTGEDGR